MMEEDSCDLESSSEESDVFSHDSGGEQNVSHKKANVSIEDNAEYLRDRDTPMNLPTSVCSCKGDLRTRSCRRMKPHINRATHLVREHQDPYYSRSDSSVSVDDVLNLLPIYPRKTRQQFRREKEAAITIQSAWRGYQVRRDIDKMNEAATQIQAAFRGYMTRKELPLGLCGYGRTDRQKLKKKIRAENENKCFPVFLNCLQQFGLASGTHAEKHNVSLPSGKSRSCHEHIIDNYPLLNPKVSFFEIKSALRPNREVFTYTSLNVFAPRIQRYQDAATTIQAAWRGYQIRQKARPMISVVKSPIKSFTSNFTIKKASWKRAFSVRTIEAHEIQQIFTSSIFGKAPRIRNINISTVVNGMPASSQKPNISIQVLCPKGVVQGFQRDMSRGAQAVYTVESEGASIPSQILIHVNMKKGKDVLSKTEKKM
ncbi:uncharacterized protein LOC121921316 [Sceloporus undulatus]|uniref:uncharacterized protein LOC121921316 n=1 Tax=Sceloporus undulatus TaxID=8520 RepID=UPI001C4CC913|nr:uncharacterized protein LOC121921316 [Sceloporus undulatus]